MRKRLFIHQYDECSRRSWSLYRMPYKYMKNDFSNISVKAYNTDVIAIILGFMEQFMGAMLEIEF